ncbi:MAG TPA: TonB-dependent receptor, partial [Bacteroidota bacterium]|nr:TonB-dependent receptor [Bacteroidota bacterium]
HVFAFTHFFSSGTFLKATLGKVEDHNGNDVAGLLPSDYSSATKNTTDPVTGFQYLGSDQSWYSGITQQYSARLDFNSQVHPLHLLKAGFEFYYETINSTDIEDPTAIGHDSLGNPAYPPFTYRHDRGLYPGYGSYRYNLSDYPNHGAAYIQDNIEFSGLNLHVGLRYDYMDIGKQVYYQDWIDAWYGAVNPTGATNGVIQPSWVNNVTNGSTFQYYALHGYVSPRLSIGYPVTDRIVFYFNYGHFLQFPDRTLYFDDAFTYNPNASNVVGNPGLKPQRTVEYESGFEDQFSDDMAFKIHAFYKDIFDYISTIPRGQWNLDVNLDYASARGFDFSVDQAVGGDFKFDATYTYQIAQGRSSNPLATIFNPQFDLPRETRLDWDQNNTFNFFATYSVKPNEEGHLFGLPFFNNYQMALNYDYGSGFPYTPYTPRTTALNVYLHNSSTLPANSTFNFNFRKGFLLANKMNLSATIDILNLLDRKNIAPGAAGFNTFTGGPNSYGDYNPATGLVSSYNSLASYVLPFVFSPPRQILFGVQLNFE